MNDDSFPTSATGRTTHGRALHNNFTVQATGTV